MSTYPAMAIYRARDIAGSGGRGWDRVEGQRTPRSCAYFSPNGRRSCGTPGGACIGAKLCRRLCDRHGPGLLGSSGMNVSKRPGVIKDFLVYYKGFDAGHQR